jgi:acetylornithine deacetylase/succinyl-diaminopimelate desuccinylase-like protein
MDIEDVFGELEGSTESRIAELMEFLSIESVSTAPEKREEVRKAGLWISQKLERMGFEVGLLETPGHPVLFASHCKKRGRPTVLIYGHFDVQPTDPEDEWVSPPFVPQVRDGCVYARGASDDKGQLLTHVHAVEAILKRTGELPLNVKFLLEGEEEIGSPSLPPVLEERKEALAADCVVISDGCQFRRGIPAITYGLRGLAYVEIEVEGPKMDLHSGSYGGLVENPVNVLCSLIARLKTPEGKVAIPGFYDDVIPLEPWERQEIKDLPFDEKGMMEYLGVECFVGEGEFTPLERRWARPTLDVNGIWGGFSGKGAKTVIPARAGAKVSMRLVPRQVPSRVCALLEAYLQEMKPRGVKVKVRAMNGADPVIIDRRLPQIQAAARAIEVGFGRPPVFIREGGSIPVVNMLRAHLGIEAILLMGWGSPEDGAHSPNERFSLEDFHRGTKTSVALLHELAR